MDETVTRLARELAEAIAAAVASDARVAACRAEARSAGYDLQLSLDAVVGFAARGGPRPPRPTATAAPAATRQPVEVTASDRRFLRSLRIAPDAAPERVDE